MNHELLKFKVERECEKIWKKLSQVLVNFNSDKRTLIQLIWRQLLDLEPDRKLTFLLPLTMMTVLTVRVRNNEEFWTSFKFKRILSPGVFCIRCIQNCELYWQMLWMCCTLLYFTLNVKVCLLPDYVNLLQLEYNLSKQKYL